MLTIPHIPLHFDNAEADKSALLLVEAYAPEWKEERDGPVVFVRFTDGITNTLTKATKNRPGKTRSEIDQDAILLRAYGKGTDVLIDREKEVKAHNVLASRGLAPQLLARFDNGLMYRFIEGDVCTPDDLRRPEIYRQVAKRLGQWHGALPVSAIASISSSHSEKGTHPPGSIASGTPRPTPNTWTVVKQWIDALPELHEREKKDKADLGAELVRLEHRFGSTPGLLGKDFVFAHCDLLSGNVIVTQCPTADGDAGERPVAFIDYEYATPSPAAFDIANHFAEWAGFDCDHAGCPTKSQRREFVHHYVVSFYDNAIGEDANIAVEIDVKAAIDQVYKQVDDFRGLPGFYWGIWGLIQAEISQIDFDYKDYARVRLEEYRAWKAEDDGSRARDGKDMPLRERRWAEE